MHGDLEFICSEIQGVENPRIVVKTKDQGHYQVVYDRGDREALKVLAGRLGLMVTREEREIYAIALRVSPGGHRLKQAAQGKQLTVEEVCCDADGRWPLDGVTADELARFLEKRYRRPVVNLTGLAGRWSVVLSHEAGKMMPDAGEKKPLDDLGLVLGWEKLKVPVTVVKDQPEKGKK